MPCLQDRYEEGGVTKNEYFWQDLLIAREIYDAKPEKHVDIGSRLDGFVEDIKDLSPINFVTTRVKFDLWHLRLVSRYTLHDHKLRLLTQMEGTICDLGRYIHLNLGQSFLKLPFQELSQILPFVIWQKRSPRGVQYLVSQGWQ